MYSDIHRYFLQFMLDDSYTSVQKGLEVYKTYSDDDDPTLNNLKTLVADINEKIARQELKIVYSTCEVTGDVNLALINTANDDVCKQQVAYTALELEYFQHVLKEIIMTEDHRLPLMACINLSDSLTTTLRKDKVEQFLDKCFQTGYLVKKDAFVYLGARCILEFAPYFQQHCKDYYSSCHLCSEPAFTGSTCPSCDKLYHNHCIEKWLRKQNVCPGCKSTWGENEQAEESVTQNGDADSEGDCRPVVTRRSKRKAREVV